MTFAILGPLEVRRDGEPVEIAGQRLRTLLGLLLLDAGHVVSVDSLVIGLWDDSPPHGVANALQALVSRLRSALAEPDPDGKNRVRQLVAAEPTGYRIITERDRVDAYRFAVLADEGRAALAAGEAASAADTLRAALGLWRGPALVELAGHPAAELEIARLDGLRLAATEDRIEADLLLGRAEDLLAELPGLLAAHPLRERLHGLHMRALYGTGRLVEALAAYEAARRIFSDELGADPSPELSDLHLSMLRRERPVQALGNLRARLTSFVGRESDIALTTGLLAQNRLITLVGPGGAGKTRLAVESAAVSAGQFPDGAWLVELAPAADEAGVTQAVLSALQRRDLPPIPLVAGVMPQLPLDRLVNMLRSEQLLLVLDNCEHVIEHAARLADRLLADCPGVRILATSREPLSIDGEITWALPPLSLPPPGVDPHLAVGYPAVRLFGDRAAAVRPGYDVTAEAEAVMRICRELDGMPLAIELAAARLRSLSAAQIADRLDDRFRLLTGGSRTALPRHQTLRAVVDWSWDLLDDEERTLAARLAVFSGGATLEAAEHICGDLQSTPVPHPTDRIDLVPDAAERIGGGLESGAVLGVLARLVDKSLVVFESGRYRMLETVRVYAAERLAASGEIGRIRGAHATHFTELAEKADPGLRREGQLAHLAEMTAEHDNLSAALRWAVDSGEGELALRLVGALGWYWWLIGHRTEGAIRIREALDAAPGASAERRALALAVYSISAMGAALPWDESWSSLREARRFARPVKALSDSASPEPHPLVALATPMFVLFGANQLEDETFVGELLQHSDPWVVATGHLFRALLHFGAGRIDDGESDAHAALDGYRSVGDRWGIGVALGSVADVHFLRDEPARGVEVMREALEAMEALGAMEDTSYLRARLAFGLNLLGERAQAERILAEVTHLVRRTGDRIGEAGVLGILGEFARQDGDPAAAAGYYARAMGLLTDSDGAPPQMVSVLTSALAMIAIQEGELDRARGLLLRAVKQAEEATDMQLIAVGVIACADLALATGRAEDAAALLGGVERLRGIAAVVDFDHVRVTEQVGTALGEEFVLHFERGLALNRADLIALALQI